MLQPGGKLLLWNSIRHVTAHNRAVEEQLLWSQKANESQRKDSRDATKRDERKDKYFRHYRSRDESTRRAKRKRHSSDHEEEGREGKVWLRRLAECKDADPDKWHHDGFKELYPEELEAEKSKLKRRKEKRGNESSQCHSRSNEGSVRDRTPDELTEHAKRKSSRHSKKKKKKHKERGQKDHDV